MRSIHYSLALIAVVLGANFFFTSCNDRHEQQSENQSLTNNSASNKVEDTVLINQGKSLFVKNCGTCHTVTGTDNYLAGVVERVGKDYLKLYLTKQDSLIKAKNNYALELKRTFGNLANVHNFIFSNDQLNAIIAYLEKYSS